jgi:hypothetical protein
MAEDETIAEAEGNAAARLYTFVTEHPNETPFETEMTPEMIEKHKYFNDDILEIAEHMERKLTELENAREELARVEANIAKLEGEGVVSKPGGNMQRAQLSARDYVQSSEAAIAMYEEEIANEIEKVRGEYRTRAENLNSRAEQFRSDYEALLRFREGERQRVQNDIDLVVAAKHISREEAAKRVNPALTEDVNDISIHLGQYERTWGDYRLLQEGLSITTWREAAMNFVWGAAEIVAIEIITAGLGTAVVAGVAGTRLAVTINRGSAALNRTLARAGKTIGDLAIKLAERYNKLLPRTKTKLDEIFARIKAGRPRPHGKPGVTSSKDDVAEATARRGCACALR